GMDAGVGVLVEADRNQGDLGSLLGQRETSETRATQVDAAMQAIITERLGCTRKLLSENLDKLHRLAALLLEHESADAETIRAELGLSLPAAMPIPGLTDELIVMTKGPACTTNAVVTKRPSAVAYVGSYPPCECGVATFT